MDLKGFTVFSELPMVEEAARELWVRFNNHITRLGSGPRDIFATAMVISKHLILLLREKLSKTAYLKNSWLSSNS